MRARRRRLAKRRRLVARHLHRFSFGTNEEAYVSWKWLGANHVDVARW